jgi:hypothetical protein
MSSRVGRLWATLYLPYTTFLYVRAAKLVHALEGRPTLYLPCTDVPYFVCVPRQTKVGREVG